MPAAPKKTRKKPNRRAAGGRPRGSAGRSFWRGLLVSAGFAFTVASAILNPQWRPPAEFDSPGLRERVDRLRPWLEAHLPQVATHPANGTRTGGAGPAPGVPSGASPGTSSSTSSDTSAGPAAVGSGDKRFSACRHFFPTGRPPELPQAASGLHDLCFDSFAVLYSSDTRTPVYVVERLNRAGLRAARAVDRTERFYPEARLPRAARAQLDDYRGSGYARGHMAPAADMPHEDAMDQSFSLANIVPQDPAHNSGAWSQIEQDTRHYVMRARGDVFVFTGPAFLARPPARIGESGVAVPSHLFKLVHDPATGRSWAHWHQNTSGPQAMNPIAYPAFVQKVGIDFLHGAD